MKKLSVILFFIATFSVSFNSCDVADPEECVEANAGCGTYTACCTSTSCYYLYDGTKYYCDGTDCTDAAGDLVDDMCKAKKDGEPCVTVEEVLNTVPRN